MKNSKYKVAVGLRKISSSMMAFTAPLAPFNETEKEFFINHPHLHPTNQNMNFTPCSL